MKFTEQTLKPPTTTTSKPSRRQAILRTVVSNIRQSMITLSLVILLVLHMVGWLVIVSIMMVNMAKMIDFLLILTVHQIQ